MVLSIFSFIDCRKYNRITSFQLTLISLEPMKDAKL